MSYPYLGDFFNALSGTHWTLPIPTFGLMVSLALVAATHVARADVMRLEALDQLPASTHRMVPDIVFLAALAGLVGARVMHLLDNLPRFLADPLPMIFTRAGFSIYGGLLAGVGAGVLFLRRRKLPIAPMLDAVAPALMLGYAIGRLGCQLAGDGDWGIAANMALKPEWLPGWLWAQTYQGNILGESIAAPGVYPTPLYEAAAALALFGVLRWLRAPGQRPGYLFSMYLLLAGFERLLIEKIRVNPRHEWLGIGATQAEVISMALIVAGLFGMIVALRGRGLWPRAILVVGVGAALSACAPR